MVEIDIKNRAKVAKNRLSSGYWQQLKTQNLDFTSVMEEFQRVEAEEKYRQIAKQTIKQNEEDDFVNKVKMILESKVEIINPIKLLITEEDLSDLDVVARQRLIFKTSERFLKVKEELEKTKSE